ncbi:spore coat protein [Cytobacillus firmus]|uniref:spore coat protein n=1 Tax=Cytobacillus firmus TaxID=1399 RepID=UPI00077C502E|nr:spore coat protein [Cytobacillus firmus]MBG9541671.1 spore gernimation protein GerQ [Cytobacillus firmus]MBG9549713.1 spore gernimation protein GerQ [Cytobacillus firmus]MBG9553500.1 spore gernimation protein GerQ [Cytobacillus firmus]MBG9556721.1 spore gernimation protein GerQ [Cytobacillus firmus]MBG9574797.1 spore gernimation protein GerQ [Cytobacillus firmus]
MNNFLKNLMGMGGMSDQVIATDFLISAKAGIRNIAFALTESGSPEVRELLREQLRIAVETHEKIINYMISRGTYYPHNLKKQLETDMKITETALKLSEKS